MEENTLRIESVLRRILCILLVIMLVAVVLFETGMAAPVPDNERTFDIGANPGDVTAELSDDGLLTISGYGDTANYTPETAPFAHKAGKIEAIEISMGITSIGDYLFYNLGNLKHCLTLPASLIRIGTGAFSGDDEASAPKPLFVKNEFEGKDIAVENTDESSENQFAIERITEQEIGGEIFFPSESGSRYFAASEENFSFAGAAESAGMTRADEILSVAFDVGNGQSSGERTVMQELPVIGGEITLPLEPHMFSGEAGDAMFRYSFKGWTESQDEPDYIREAGSAYQVNERDDLYFVASWEKTPSIDIWKSHDNGTTTFEIPSVDGYEYSNIRWQVGEIDFATGEYVWNDIEGETSQILVREIQPGDEHREFRAQMSVKKAAQRGLFALFSSSNATEEEVTLAPVRAMGAEFRALAAAEVETASLSFNAGTNGAGSMETLIYGLGAEVLVPWCDFTYNYTNTDKKAFNGWSGSDGGTYHPGDSIILTQDLTLTAMWTTYTAVVANNIAAVNTAIANFNSGTWYTNYVIINFNGTTSTTGFGSPFGGSRGVTVTSFDPCSSGGTMRTMMFQEWEGSELGGPIRFENITLRATQSQVADLFLRGNPIVIGKNVSTAAYSNGNTMRISGGGRYNDLDGNVDMRIFGGAYRDITGCTSWYNGINGNIRIAVMGGTVTGGVYGTSMSAASIRGDIDIKIGGNVNITGNVYAGGNQATITGNTKMSVSGGTIGGGAFGGGIGAAVTGSSEMKVSGGLIGGNVYGGGDQGAGRVGGNASVEITGGTINGRVYGGGNMGPVEGGTSVNISGGEIMNNIFGAGGNAAIGAGGTNRDSLVSVSGGTISGNIFGGGDQAGGTVPGKTQVQISGGEITGTVYGGGNAAAVPATSVDISGGTIGAVYGGGLAGNVSGTTYVSAGNAEVTGDIYGGGMNGTVNSTYVELSGVNVGGNVYGGGENAAVAALVNPGSSSPVQIAGGSVTGEVYGGGKNGAVNSASGVSISGGAVIGTVYGGGEDAEVTGTTHVLINNSGVTNEVYGGGKNGRVRSTYISITGVDSTIGALAELENPANGNVYGGGEGASATISDAASSTSVTIDAAKVYGTVFGGGNAAVAPRAEIIIANGAKVGSAFGGGYNGAITGSASVSITDSSTYFSVFGGGKEGTVNSASLLIENSAIGTDTTEGHIYGGGEGAAAHVTTGTPAVTIKNTSVSGSVFGGGDKGNVQSARVDIIGSCSIAGSVYGGGKGDLANHTLGLVDGNAVLRIYNESGNARAAIGGSVYGGGDSGNVNGSATVTLESATVSESAYAGGNNGEVTGNTSLNISGGAVGRNAYGGSLMGPVGGDSSLNISGGLVGRNAFGGSRGSSSDINSGTVSGNSVVSVTNGTVGENGFVPSNPEESGNLIAGGEYAPVLGNSTVTVNITTGGIATSVYGGGFFAPVGTNSAGGIATVNIQKGLVGARVYGGGYGSERATTRQSTVNITGGTVGATVYGGGALGIVNGIGNDSTFINISGGEIMGSVFGAGQGQATVDAAGGSFGLVRTSTNVEMTGGTVRGIIYGGGDYGNVGTGTMTNGVPAATPSATVGTNIHMTGGTVGVAVFGGGSGAISANGSDGVIFGNTGVIIERGSIGSAVWGGCNRSYVTGDTSVDIDPSLGNITLNGTIYGGGNIPSGDNPVYRDDMYLVLGQAEIYLNGQNGANTMQMTGSIFGGGNLTTVQGSKTVFIENYTGDIESLQRADEIYVRNSNIRLFGADDVTEPALRYYSVAVVGELIIANGSTVTVDKEVRYLSELTAATVTGAYPTLTTSYHSAEASRNTLRIYQGRILQIRNNAGIFGMVNGVFWLDILSESGSDEFGVTIQAALASRISADGNPASAPADTGAFIRADTDSGRNLPLQSGKTSSYAYWRLGSAASVIDLTIRAVHQDNGGTGDVTAEFELPTSMTESSYIIEDPIEKNGSFNLVLPSAVSNGVTFPTLNSSSGQNKNNTFILSVEATNDGDPNGTWEETGSVVYFSTETPSSPPPSPWTSNAGGVWRYGSLNPSTTADGPNAGANGKAVFELHYEPDFRGFVGGTMKATFKEYEEGMHIGTVIVNLTIEGEESTNKVQTADIAKGKVFSEIYNETPPDVEINGLSEVSTFFTTVYYPEVAGASGMNVTLLAEGADTEAVNFPLGTRIILADMNNTSAMNYYTVLSTQSGGAASISLDNFVSLGTGTQAHYPGPTDNTKRITEKILIVLDFSGVAGNALLPDGDYSVCLRHSNAEAFTQKAGFTVAQNEFALGAGVSANKTGDRKVDVILTQHIPPQETRVDEGAEFLVTMLTDTGIQAAIYPTAAFAVNSGVVFINADGTLTVKSSVPSTTLTIDFSGVTQTNLPGGSYKFGIDVLQLDISAEMQSAITLADGNAGGDSITSYPQAVKASVADNSDRLLDVSEGSAELEVNIALDNLEPGDAVTAEVLKKVGTAPVSSSYTGVASGASWVALTGTGESRLATVTVPQRQAAGTYRLMIRVINGDGITVAEAPCNFIVK